MNLSIYYILSSYLAFIYGFSDVERLKLRDRAKSMFYHGYNNYQRYAYPYDELKPLSCTGHDTWGSFSLTLIDSLDTLIIMGNTTEFARVVEQISHLNFDKDINVSVFETNIRVVGGLLSAHLLMYKSDMELPDSWPCDGPLLRQAIDIAERLLPAFNTSTGMPYGTVNLKNGVPNGETQITCTASIGTFIIEFGTISELTGDERFRTVALNALNGLWQHRSKLGLLGNHVNIQTGKWSAVDFGIGAGIDSYFEYLVKGGVLFRNDKLLNMFDDLDNKIHNYTKLDDWYVWVHMDTGKITLPVFQSLDAYWPGVQVLMGKIGEASRTLHTFYSVWKQFGFTPEFYQLGNGLPLPGREAYPLRPELIESTMYLYFATKDPYFLEIGRNILESIEKHAWTPCGYASIKNVITHEKEDRMESFFLAETTKYLYLLFDHDNFIHHNGNSWTNAKDRKNFPQNCFLGSSGFIFNTEAHPMDIAGVHCCQQKSLATNKPLVNSYNNGTVDDGQPYLSGRQSCNARPFAHRMFALGSFIEDSI